MTDIERIVQLLVIEMELSLDKMEVASAGLQGNDHDAEPLFQWMFEDVHKTLEIAMNFKDNNNLVQLIDAAIKLAAVSGECGWSYRDNLRLVAALRITMRVVKSEMESEMKKGNK